MRRAKRKGAEAGRVRAAASCGLALLALPGCFTYSSYQSARIVEKGGAQGALAVSRSRIVREGPDEDTWWAIEGGARFGLAKRVDGSFLLSLFPDVQEGWGAAVLTIDVRGGIVENYIAAVMPVSATLGDSYLASLRVQPGLVATLPLGDRAEINGSARAHIFVRATDLFAMGYNVGLGLKSESGAWTIRPELGWMRFAGEHEGLTYAQYGIGMEFRAPRKSAGKE